MYNNLYNKTCTCGYNETGHKPCIWDGKSYILHAGYFHLENNAFIPEEYSKTHSRQCSACKAHIMYSYYMNQYGNGTLYNVTMGKAGSYAEYCIRSDGNRLNCNNLGYCSKCTNNVQSAHSQSYVDLVNGQLLCGICGLVWGEVTYEQDIDNNVPALNTIKIKVKVYDQYQLTEVKSVGIIGLESNMERIQTFSQEISDININEKSFTIIINTKLKSNVKTRIYIESRIMVNGRNVGISGLISLPDKIKPEITEISSDESLTEWSKSKPIVIKGTENYCDNVNVKIVEVGNEENVIFEGGANVVNGKYEISCIPEIETGEVGKKYKIIVTDTCENFVEKEFEIAKVDAIPPEITSGDSVSSEWAKEKLFTFSSVDTGIGQVQIAFNNENDYSLAKSDGTNFTKDYKFVGDVYQPKRAIVLYKDGLGNVSSKEVVIDKLDNTAPNITNVMLHNNKLSVTSNDIKEGLGEGSGVAKYKYLASKEKITNPYINDQYTEIASSEEIRIDNIAESKYIYIYAEDAVRKCK